MRWPHRLSVTLSSLLLASLSSLASANVVISEIMAAPSDRIVRYSADGVPQIGYGTPWYADEFDDSEWLTGRMPMGFGEWYSVETNLHDLIQKRALSTVFLRCHVSLSSPPAAPLTVKALYDDGLVVYMAGEEAVRLNNGPKHMPVLFDQYPLNKHRYPGGSENYQWTPSASLFSGLTSTVVAMQVNTFAVDIWHPTTMLVKVSVTDAHGQSILTDATDCKYFPGIAEPSSGLYDADLSTDDSTSPTVKLAPWVELKNTATEPVDLSGWSMTDNTKRPTKFVFPPSPHNVIPPGGYLIVIGDDLDITTSRYIHLNFSFDGDGESLSLFDAAGGLVDELEYPSQNSFHSYGLVSAAQANVSGQTFMYMSKPTPGQDNDDTLTHLYGRRLKKPTFNPPHGFYDNAFTLSLTTEGGGNIFYTLDGSDPVDPATRHAYNKTVGIPITSQGNRKGVVVRAVAELPDRLPSRIATGTFLVGQDPALSSLQTLCISADERRCIYKPAGITAIKGGHYDEKDQWIFDGPLDYNLPTVADGGLERPVSLEVMGETPGLSHLPILPLDHAPDVQKDMGWRLSASFFSRERMVLSDMEASPWDMTEYERFSQNWYFRKAYSEESGWLNAMVIPGSRMTRFDTFRNRAGKNDNINPFLVDEFVRRLSLRQGQVASIGAFFGLYVNAEYKGYYNLCDRLREPFMQEWYRNTATFDVIAALKRTYKIQDGGDEAFRDILDLLNDSDMNDPTRYAYVGTLVDYVAVADYFALNIFAAMWDWPYGNWVFGKARPTPQPEPNATKPVEPDCDPRACEEEQTGRKWRFYIWDGEGGFAVATQTNGPSHDTVGTDLMGPKPDAAPEVSIPGQVWRGLYKSDEWKLLFADRLQKHYFSASCTFCAKSVWEVVTPMKDILTPIEYWTPQNGHSPRVDWLDPWMAARGAYLFGDYDALAEGNVPSYSGRYRSQGLWPGTVAPSYTYISESEQVPTIKLGCAPGDGSAILYYTADGSDPRLPHSGDVNPAATQAAAALHLTLDRGLVCARCRSNDEWSPLTTISPPKKHVIISEISYHDDWVELFNPNPYLTVALRDYALADEHNLEFLPFFVELAPLSFFVVALDVVGLGSKDSVRLLLHDTNLVNYSSLDFLVWAKDTAGIGPSMGRCAGEEGQVLDVSLPLRPLMEATPGYANNCTLIPPPTPPPSPPTASPTSSAPTVPSGPTAPSPLPPSAPSTPSSPSSPPSSPSVPPTPLPTHFQVPSHAPTTTTAPTTRSSAQSGLTPTQTLLVGGGAGVVVLVAVVVLLWWFCRGRGKRAAVGDDDYAQLGHGIN